MDIEEYKNLVINNWMLRPSLELKEEYGTERLCWAFVIWTYKLLNIQIETENKIKQLTERFDMRVKPLYRFPDVVLFRHTRFCTHYLGRHAGVMLNNEEFVHVMDDAGGVHFTSLKEFPWNDVPYMIIRQKNETNRN